MTEQQAAAPTLDVDGFVHWQSGDRPADVAGPCPHTCIHDETRVVAWGPNYEFDTLISCTVPTERGGCDDGCRAWTSESPWDNQTIRPFAQIVADQRP